MDKGKVAPSACSAFVVTISLILVGPAWAQQGTSASAKPTTDADALTEIIVTATRTEERAQTVPISMTVFNQRELEDHNIVNAGDLAAYTPSLSVNTQYGPQNSSFAIRGFVQDQGTAPSVGTFFADVVEPRGPNNADPAGDSAPPGSFFDLENVQILKGPQGTLFGLNTTGGDVLIVPKKPTADFGGYAEITAGNYGMKGAQGVINLPLNDRVKFRLGFNYERQDGYLKNISGIGPDNFDNVNFIALRASALIDVTDTVQNYTILTYNRSDTNGFFEKTIACENGLSLGSFACAQLAKEAAAGAGFYDGEQSVAVPSSKLTQWQIINTTEWHASDALTIKNIASYAQYSDYLNDPLFGTDFATPAIPGIYPSFTVDFAHPGPPPGTATANEDTYTEELQFQGNAMDHRFTWQGGLYFEGSDPLGLEGVQSDILGSCTNVATLQCFDPVGFLSSLAAGVPVHVASANYYEGFTHFRDYAVYGQASQKLNDQFKITAGLRYTYDNESNTDNSVAYSGFPYFPTPVNPALLTQSCVFTVADTVAEGCPTRYELHSHAPTGMIDLDYTPNENILDYAKYTRGYRAGAINPDIGPPYNYTQPEKVDTFEIGTKMSFMEPISGIFNVSVFDNEFRNQQLSVGFIANDNAPVAPTSVPLNAGKSRIYGAEVEARIIPITGVTLAVGYTYLNARIISVPNFPAVANSAYVVSGPPAAGDRLTLTPKDKVTLTATYTLPIDPAIGKVTIGATFTHTDSEVANYIDNTLIGTPFTNLSILPPTNLLDLNLNWISIAGSPIDLSVFATNVTNDQYYTTIPGLAQGTGFETAGLGQPTMYGARLRYHFGK
jgi:iron complex outermembrane receptor protein